jgi:hypothetical protein
MSNISRQKLGEAHRFPTQDRLKELLLYDENTGILRWKKKRKGVKEDGMIAGCPTHDGYLKVSIDGTQYKAHHVIWCYVTGEWPVLIDHKDTIGMHNFLENLRKTTPAGNAQNTKSKKTISSPSRLKGAYLDKRRDRWHSRIIANGQLKILGYFSTAEEAHLAYVAAAKNLHGEFARMA